ncbi:MAG: Ig-like domain-containing protein [Omnitrophica WOR_2 bacterium]
MKTLGMSARLCVLLVLCVAMLPFKPAQAQASQLTLNLKRDFGYNSGTGKIQGTFTITVSGPANVNRVIFYIDNTMMGEANTAPFKLQFLTDKYPVGLHTIHATGYTSDNQELVSNRIQAEFVTADEGLKAAGQIAVPILGIVLVIAVLSILFPILSSRGKKVSLALGSPRNYGVSGGAICPRCKRPFAIHFYGLNLLTRKLDRCPYCGRWSAVKRLPLDVLRQAEKDELTFAKEGELIVQESEEEKLRKELDDSRYQGL